MEHMNSYPHKFKNTFLPELKDKTVTVHNVIQLLRMGLKFEVLPEEVKKAVRDYVGPEKPDKLVS